MPDTTVPPVEGDPSPPAADTTDTAPELLSDSSDRHPATAADSREPGVTALRQADTHAPRPGTETDAALEPSTERDQPASPEDTTTGKPRAPQRRLATLPRPGRRAVAFLAAAVLICAALGASGFMLWQHHATTADQQRTAEFSAAARQGAVTLTSLDFNHAKDDVQRIIDNSTGEFRDDFQSRAEDFTKVIEQSKVATEGKADVAAVESMTQDSAVVLVAATSQVTNAAGAQQEPRAWRLSMTVTRDAGQLKMSKVEFVP
ncbi:hypothetical protein [Nocardia callitridis]|uniref:hypothetical protein n=1 Tax=Nocardia callitridis TaxID=648753 RepID=UPI003CD0B4BD